MKKPKLIIQKIVNPNVYEINELPFRVVWYKDIDRLFIYNQDGEYIEYSVKDYLLICSRAPFGDFLDGIDDSFFVAIENTLESLSPTTTSLEIEEIHDLLTKHNCQVRKVARKYSSLNCDWLNTASKLEIHHALLTCEGPLQTIPDYVY